MTAEYLNDCLDNLRQIANIIESVDNRCMAADGPVTLTQDEISEIYQLSISLLPDKEYNQ